MVKDSILKTIKNMLGVGDDDTNFDTAIIIHINGAIMILHQLGVGPKGYTIQGADNTWEELLSERTDLELVKTAIYLRVRMVFDPPQNSFLVNAIKEQIVEFDWRIEIDHNSEE